MYEEVRIESVSVIYLKIMSCSLALVVYKRLCVCIHVCTLCWCVGAKCGHNHLWLWIKGLVQFTECKLLEASKDVNDSGFGAVTAALPSLPISRHGFA